LAGHCRDDLRQTLAAVLGRARQRAPTSRGESLISFLPARRRLDLSVDELRSRAVADRIEWVQHLAAELAGFLDDGTHCFLVETLGDAALDQVRQPCSRLERKQNVVYGSPVGHLVFLEPHWSFPGV